MQSYVTKQMNAFRGGDAGKLSVLMFTAFIDMAGALMIIPLLPFYAKRFGASDLSVTLLVASFSAMQLLSAPLWGRVSDRYGRKPALLFGLGASMIAYIVFGFADSFWLLLVSRIIQGAGGGTTGVIQAYVADSMAPKDRAKGLGWLSASTNAGVALGPLLASFTHQLGPHSPGLIAALLCGMNILFALRFLPESHSAGARLRTATARKPLDAVARVAWTDIREPYARLIWMYAVSIGAFYGVNVLIILYLQRNFSVTENNIGFFFAYIGSLGILFRLFLLGRAVDKLGEVRTARLGAATLGMGLALIPFMRPWGNGSFSFAPFAIVIALVPLGAALNFPSVTALLSRVVGEHERGLYMGVQQTYGGLARVVYPMVAGFASDNFGKASPFWISATLVFSTILMGSGLAGYARRMRDHEAPGASAEAAPTTAAAAK